MRTISASNAFFNLLDTSMGIKPAVPESKLNANTPIKPALKHAGILFLPSKTLPVDSALQKRPKTLADAPLQLGDVLDDEAEGIYQDPEFDMYARVNIDWSPEAPLLKRLFESELHRDENARISARVEYELYMKQLAARFGEANAKSIYEIKRCHSSNHAPTSQYTPNQEKQRQKIEFNESFLINFFQNLELSGLRIGQIDGKMKRFQNLKKLSIIGNELESIDNLPEQLEILSLQTNRLTDCPVLNYLNNLIHLGLGWNKISSVSSILLPEGLVYLDLQHNHISDIETICDNLSFCDNLKFLYLQGNPIALLKSYRTIVVKSMPTLLELDGRPINKSERQVTLPADENVKSIAVFFKLGTLLGLFEHVSKPPSPAETDGKDVNPPDSYDYYIQVMLKGYPAHTLQTPTMHYIPLMESKSAKGNSASAIVGSNMDFQFQKNIAFPIDLKTLECFSGPQGMDVLLKRRRIMYVPRIVPPQSEADKGATTTAANRGGKGGGRPGSGRKREKDRAQRRGSGTNLFDEEKWMKTVAEEVIIYKANMELASLQNLQVIEKDIVLESQEPIGSINTPAPPAPSAQNMDANPMTFAPVLPDVKIRAYVSVYEQVPFPSVQVGEEDVNLGRPKS